ncbi:MAG: M14 family metallopeptidase [Fimbriimonadales bacterium]
MLTLIPAPPPQDWQLTYEKSKFMETGRYAEAIEFCKRLDDASPNAKVIRYGMSGEGRPMIALLISKGQVKGSAKPLVLVINGIHAGEIEGKDANLILARRILITKKEQHLIDKVDLLIIPIFNVDGHERFSAYSRINQNGPKEMGWRATATNRNLNRDFIKADTPEMRGWLRLFNEYKPEFIIDNHTTDGGDWQYDGAYAIATAQTQHPSVAEWSSGLVKSMTDGARNDGYLLSPYFGGFDASAPERGISVEDFSPRYSTGYGSAVNRPSMLVETHVLKPYKRRVETTYNMNVRMIEFCARTALDLIARNSRADSDAKRMVGKPVVLSARAASASRFFEFLGYEYKPYMSEISGAEIPSWNRSKKIAVKTTIRDKFEPSTTILAPYAYAIPSQWTEAIELLEVHGIGHRKTKASARGTFSTYRFDNVQFPRSPFEGRFMPTFSTIAIREARTLPAGSVLVGSGQIKGKLVSHLLEPDAPDSLLRWGFFNAIFEEKEFFEDYAMEPYAKRMLQNDPTLRAKFQEALKNPAFANNPNVRLAFFYDRSPFADAKLRKYPVLRLSKEETRRLK